MSDYVIGILSNELDKLKTIASRLEGELTEHEVYANQTRDSLILIRQAIKEIEDELKGEYIELNEGVSPISLLKISEIIRKENNISEESL